MQLNFQFHGNNYNEKQKEKMHQQLSSLSRRDINFILSNNLQYQMHIYAHLLCEIPLHWKRHINQPQEMNYVLSGNLFITLINI